MLFFISLRLAKFVLRSCNFLEISTYIPTINETLSTIFDCKKVVIISERPPKIPFGLVSEISLTTFEINLTFSVTNFLFKIINCIKLNSLAIDLYVPTISETA